MKERKKRIDKTYPMFNQYADDESYKRYKHRQYRNLIIKSFFPGCTKANLRRLTNVSTFLFVPVSYLPPSIKLISTSKEYYAYSPLVKELGETERKRSGVRTWNKAKIHLTSTAK